MTGGDRQHRRHQIGGVGRPDQEPVGARGQGGDGQVGVGPVAHGQDPDQWRHPGHLPDRRQPRRRPGPRSGGEVDDSDVGPEPADEFDRRAAVVGASHDGERALRRAAQPRFEQAGGGIVAGDHHDLDRPHPVLPP